MHPLSHQKADAQAITKGRPSVNLFYHKGDLLTSTILKKGVDFLEPRIYNGTRKEVKPMSPRTGRPKATNPKANSYHVRLDSETDARLSKYCQEHGLSKVEAIRQGVLLLLEKQK